jgi:small-conductance mechanosensitive channel
MAGGILVGLAVAYTLLFILRTLERGAFRFLFSTMHEKVRSPLRVLLPLIALAMIIPITDLSEAAAGTVQQVLEVLIILNVAWLFTKLVRLVQDLILSRFELEAKDNLLARKVYTQVTFFRRVAVVVIGVLTLAVILMNFSRVRELGTTILASAGVLGIVLGFAAQKTLGTLIAGLQIAVTQPIKIDDVVIVEGEWGRIEEITLTYVVVRIWDLRRLILPITYFVEKPFQNWTRESANLLGSVFLYTDFRIPVQEVREELTRVLDGHPLWDREVCTLQVTDLSERGVELRALMSARNSSDAWNLRCDVREKLLEFVQDNYPQSLPRFRAELEREPGGGDTGAARHGE